MTNMKDELLKYFDYIVQQADIARAHSPEHDVIFDNAVKKIRETIEKATPKKPNWIYDDEPLCPCCGEVLDSTEEHCDECDQRLDWGDTYVD